MHRPIKESEFALRGHRHDALYPGAEHDHSGSPNGPKLAQANTHESPDTDSATTALHHTLGTGANQAAAGNHNHSGVYAPVANGVTNGDSHDHSGGDGAQIAYSSLSGLPPIQMALHYHANGAAAITLTDQGSAQEFLASQSRNLFKVDLTGYTSIRLTARINTASTSANTPKIYLLYRATFSASSGDYSSSPGTGAVECSLASGGYADSGWVTLDSGAKADIFLGCFQSGGDADKDPVISRITAFVKV